jgi:DNA-binding MarR family transcriptional regulator
MGQASESASAKVSAANKEARILHMLIGQVGTGLYRAVEQELRPLGIPIMHSAVLFVLKAEDRPVAAADISRRIMRRPQSTLQLIGRMEKQGYVTIQRGPRKRGPVKVVMTDKGKEAVDLAWKRERAVADVISVLSKEERRTLKLCLERLRDSANGVVSSQLYH